MAAKTKAAHTPEPWQVGLTNKRMTYINAGRDCICMCDGPRHRANARLIAAAPTLYEALKAMVDRWEPDCIGTDRVMWENAVAALAKAEG